MSNRQLLKIEFYVPEEQLQQVKQAMFDAGAGKVGGYDSCAWQVLGQEQYKPGEGSNPFKGEQGSLETLREYKVEMVCVEEFMAEVVRAMKESHPYEEVAHSVIRTEVFE
jgi:hypothetical protein